MLPRVIVHNMVSVDGRMDWSAGDIGLYYQLATRLQYDAILSSSNTMIEGTKALSEDDWREQEDAEPLNSEFEKQIMVVVDSQGRMRNLHRMRRTAYWGNTIVLCAGLTPKSYLDHLHEHDMDYIQCGQNHVDLQAALSELKNKYKVAKIRVDSGGTLNGLLFRQGLVDELSLLLAPILVGGRSPRSLFVSPDLTTSAGTIPLKLIHVEKFPENYIWLRYEVQK